MIFLIAHLQESDFLTMDNSSLETNDYYMVSLPDCLALTQLLLNGFCTQIICTHLLGFTFCCLFCSQLT